MTPHLKKLFTASILALSLASLEAQNYWTNAAGTLNWSDTLNWANWAVPGTTENVTFEDQVYTSGFTNTHGAVNNVVDASFTIGSASYTATNGHYYNTFIPAGRTLTLNGSGTEPTLLSGASYLLSGTRTNYAVIAGPGTFVINNSGGRMEVRQAGRATLNLAQLTNYTANLSNIWVGVAHDPGIGSGPGGVLILAQTNTINTVANPAGPGILIGRGATNSAYGQLILGKQSTVSTDGLVVGGNRATSFSPNNILSFTAGTVSNRFILRGSAGGSTPTAIFSIADVSANESGYGASPFMFSTLTASADFTGGSVDIMADTINVARTGLDSADTVNDRGGVTGSLLFEQGTIEATNLNVGYYQHTVAQSWGQGTVTARSNAVLNVYNNIVLAFLNTTNGMAFTPTTGTLNVNDSAIVNVGGDILDGGGLTSINLAGGSINMRPGYSSSPGSVTVKNLNGFGAISNAHNIVINRTNVLGTTTTAGSLLLDGNLTMQSNSIVYFNIGTNNIPGPAGGSDYIWVGGTNAQFNNPRMYITLAGPLSPSTTYTLIDCSNATSVTGSVNAESPRYAPVLVTSTGVVMVVNADTNVSSVVWVGQLGNVWDTSLVNTNWLYSGSADSFRQYDNVVFDDSCLNQVVWPSGQLYPSSITFNGNTKNFFVTNRYNVTPIGSVNGATGITKNGTNTVTWGLTNTFTGPVNINNGVLKLFDPTFTSPGGALVLGASNGPINIANGATLDISGIGVISIGKTNLVSGNGFNGQGAITNSNTSGGPTERWYFKLAGDSTFALNTSPMTIQNPAQTVTYGGWLDLNGFTLTKSGASFLAFQQCSVTNSGNINLAGGELRLNHTWLGGSGSLNLSNGTFLTCFSGSTTSLVTKASINLAANASAAIVAPNSASASLPTFLVGSAINLGGSLTVSNFMTVQVTNAISGAGSLVKAGTSNLVLTAANSFSGPTTINGGRIVLATGSALGSTNITINGGGLDVTASGLTLAAGQLLNYNATNATVLGNLTVASGAVAIGIGTNAGNLTVNSGGTLSAGPLATAGTLAIATNLTLNSANVSFQLGGNTTAGNGINDLLICSNLTLTGLSTFSVTALDALVTSPDSSYTLLQYSGTLSGDAGNLSVASSNPHYSFAVVDPTTTPGLIQIQVTAIGNPVDVWRGLAAPNPSTWDFGVTTNWLNTGSPSVFYSGDTAIFDDTGLTNGVDLVGILAPASITISNNSAPYQFRGSGRLQAGTLTIDSTSIGGLTIASASSNTFLGTGITLNSATTLTFSQPANTLLAAKLNGSGTLVKQGANILTVVGNSETNYFGTNIISAGTLRPGSPDALGGTNATITILPGGTLDLNGQPVADNVLVNGGGAGGAGAINNTGVILLTNRALANLVLTGPTTLSATSNRWDVGRWIPDPLGGSQPPWVPVGSYFNAQSNSLTKIGTNDVYIHASGETYLADINIGAGRLVIDNPTWNDNATPTLGYVENTITVSNGGTLGLGGGFPFQQQANGVTWGVDGGTKPLHLLSGGRLEAVSGSSILSGTVTLETNTVIQTDSGSAGVTLAGSVTGPGSLLVTGSGQVQLSGANTYNTNTVVAGGALVLANSAALPANSLVVLSNSFSGLALANSVTIPSNARLRMLNGTSLSGDGTWSGPVQLSGSAFTFNGSLNGLNVTGPIDASSASGTVTLDFDSIHFATPLQFQGTLNITYQSGLSAGTLYRPILTLDAQNFWTNMTVARARINIRANNALPPLAPIFAGTLLAGVSDRTLILDLGGYNQTLSSLTANVGYISEFRIGNSSPVSDSILTYAGTGANSWSANIVDDLDQNGGKTIGLNVTSGSLTLSAISGYTGPTAISGGELFVTGELGNTTVTVSGTGLLGGTGTIDGKVNLGTGGTLSPGLFIGTLSILGPLSLESGTCWFQVNNQTASNDRVVAGGINYGGTLIVTNVGPTPYANGQVLPLFGSTGGFSGSFASIQIPGVAQFDASNLSSDGSITVLTPTATTPVAMTSAASGNVLQLSWPADHIGWHLQSQTNSAGVGNNWYDVPGTSQTNFFNLPIASTNRAVFYRLAYP